MWRGLLAGDSDGLRMICEFEGRTIGLGRGEMDVVGLRASWWCGGLRFNQ